MDTIYTRWHWNKLSMNDSVILCPENLKYHIRVIMIILKFSIPELLDWLNRASLKDKQFLTVLLWLSSVCMSWLSLMSSRDYIETHLSVSLLNLSLHIIIETHLSVIFTHHHWHSPLCHLGRFYVLLCPESGTWFASESLTSSRKTDDGGRSLILNKKNGVVRGLVSTSPTLEENRP